MWPSSLLKRWLNEPRWVCARKLFLLANSHSMRVLHLITPAARIIERIISAEVQTKKVQLFSIKNPRWNFDARWVDVLMAVFPRHKRDHFRLIVVMITGCCNCHDFHYERGYFEATLNEAKPAVYRSQAHFHIDNYTLRVSSTSRLCL